MSVQYPRGGTARSRDEAHVELAGRHGCAVRDARRRGLGTCRQPKADYTAAFLGIQVVCAVFVARVGGQRVHPRSGADPKERDCGVVNRYAGAVVRNGARATLHHVDRAAVDGDIAGGPAGAAADASAVVEGFGDDRAAADGNGSGVAAFAAADGRAAVTGSGRNDAATDGDTAAAAIDAAANRRAVIGTCGRDLAAGDGGAACISILAAANGRAPTVAYGRNRAASNSDGSAGFVVAAADAGAVAATRHHELAGFLFLAVDGKTIAAGYIDARIVDVSIDRKG